jgi:hypothetical protein
MQATGCMVIRNAGGRANASAVNDILVLDGLMGVTDIAIVHHTGLSSTRRILLRMPRQDVANGAAERDRLRTDVLERREHPGNAERETSVESGS